MARCSKSDGRLSPISVDGKTHENLFLQQMKCSKPLYVTFANTLGLARGTKVTFPCNYQRMIHLSSHGVTVFSANALGKEAEQAVASLENQLWREPRFHQALHDLTECCGATVHLACTIQGTSVSLMDESSAKPKIQTTASKHEHVFKILLRYKFVIGP